jgi:cell wall-associated NlpC family hydrolase
MASFFSFVTSLLALSGASTAIPTRDWLAENTARQDNGTVPSQVLAKAMSQAGLPYAWGGGSCDGPSHDQPPYQYGDIGYDCSGLVCYALCQVTGRDLFSEGLRVTSTMYCASESELGYKKYPFEERIPGDAIFFGGACECGGSDIHHVGLAMDGGDRLWNAPSDDSNEVKESSISGFGEDPCPYVIRFT